MDTCRQAMRPRSTLGTGLFFVYSPLGSARPLFPRVVTGRHGEQKIDSPLEARPKLHTSLVGSVCNLGHSWAVSNAQTVSANGKPYPDPSFFLGDRPGAHPASRGECYTASLVGKTSSTGLPISSAIAAWMYLVVRAPTRTWCTAGCLTFNRLAVLLIILPISLYWALISFGFMLNCLPVNASMCQIKNAGKTGYAKTSLFLQTITRSCSF